MKKLFAAFLIIFVVTGIAVGCTGTAMSERGKPGDKEGKDVKEGKSAPIEITISAAASLKDALNEIKPLYEAENPDIKLVLNLGSSGTLQQHIEQGAPVDLFISAGQSQMDGLEEKQLLINTSRVNILGNELVLIVGKDNYAVNTFNDLNEPWVKHIGIGEPELVPAGKYAREVLTSLEIWDNLKPKYVQAKDVRQVLAYVEAGVAEAGLVYKSDTTLADKVRIAAVAPENSHKPIVYPAAVIKSSKNSAAAGDFIRFLSRPDVKNIFKKYGFMEPTQ